MYTQKPFSDETDYQHVCALTSRVARQRWPIVTMSTGDLDWWRRADLSNTLRQSMLLWYHDQHLVAMLWHTDNQIDIIYDDTQPQLWGAIVAYVRANYPPATQIWMLGTQLSAQVVLRQHGLSPRQSHFKLHVQDPQFAPTAQIPAGITCTPLQARHVDSRAAAQRDAFQSTKMTSEIYHHVRTLPNYTAAWDMAALNSDDEVVAFATVWIDSAAGMATFEPVGCRQAYQRQGITRALICHTLSQLAVAGVRQARVLSVADNNHPSIGLYHSCGFTTVAEYVPWESGQE